MFKKAERKKAKLRLAMCAPSGAGKTYSSLLLAQGLGGRIAMIDTERGSGELYSNLCEYDVCQIEPPYTPQKYVAAIRAAEKEGYSVIIIDSLTHAWSGQGGILEEVDKRKSKPGNDFAAWREVTPQHNALVDAILQSSCHIIATMRTKTAYDMVKDDRTGKVKPVKVGLSPVQRDGMEYEFTIVLDIELDRHFATASKDRTSMFDGQIFIPTIETGIRLREWLESGTEVPPAVKQQTQIAPAPKQAPQPTAPKPGPDPLITDAQRKHLMAIYAGAPREDRLADANQIARQAKPTWQDVASFSELTARAAAYLIEQLEEMKKGAA